MWGINLATDFLNNCVPLWFTLVMGFTAPYMWSTYVKKGIENMYNSRFGQSDN